MISVFWSGTKTIINYLRHIGCRESVEIYVYTLSCLRREDVKCTPSNALLLYAHIIKVKASTWKRTSSWSSSFTDVVWIHCIANATLIDQKEFHIAKVPWTEILCWSRFIGKDLCSVSDVRRFILKPVKFQQVTRSERFLGYCCRGILTTSLKLQLCWNFLAE